MPAMTPDDLATYLADLRIDSTTVTHPPLHTVEESQALRGEIEGAHTKNLFLKDKKGRLFLVVAPEDSVVELKHLHHKIGASGRLSFGKPDLLHEVLGVLPGSVTPFGLANDDPPRVTVVLDAALMASETVNCHPLVNTATTTIRSADLVTFLLATGHEPLIVALDEATATG